MMYAIRRICEIDYIKQYFLNTVALPLTFILLVAATWRFNAPTLKDVEGANWEARKVMIRRLAAETLSNKRADYYFAFFLCCEYLCPLGCCCFPLFVFTCIVLCCVNRSHHDPDVRWSFQLSPHLID
jgi:hypothetical protein